ncbi:hypothetical protein Hypma_012134 [Hypsizygus marmoreus]|uniref:Uncharacterized protein n=1 Tax=Hypsizygus marmoreus TaxID=39966 RepID=A0A369JHC6_HYPMA|nr:hypothetical protein Hypma_012134 [Hypsizygus marmoreus]
MRASSSVGSHTKGLDPSIFLCPPPPALFDPGPPNPPVRELPKLPAPALDSLKYYFASLTIQEYAMVPSSHPAMFSEVCFHRRTAGHIPIASASTPPRLTGTQEKTPPNT